MKGYFLPLGAFLSLIIYLIGWVLHYRYFVFIPKSFTVFGGPMAILAMLLAHVYLVMSIWRLGQGAVMYFKSNPIYIHKMIASILALIVIGAFYWVLNEGYIITN